MPDRRDAGQNEYRRIRPMASKDRKRNYAGYMSAWNCRNDATAESLAHFHDGEIQWI